MKDKRKNLKDIDFGTELTPSEKEKINARVIDLISSQKGDSPTIAAGSSTPLPPPPPPPLPPLPPPTNWG
ncbi:hypothetical protein [Nodularia sp. NIES-3585]|uniref:hypothetical protein n=1 Tax=Nodularia sp. NIES-3585 TaxID=1973477 RepID=UPI000B5CE92F|nr:hypothetical protein [Nodularia sp. NIES-3585]GAX38375.1 hypothetical protein NIES3585_44240 [Nodularia sp. NIES-3585]